MQIVQPHRGSRVSAWRQALTAHTTQRFPALEERSNLLTALTVFGVLCGLIITALRGDDPSVAGAYAVACIMIGGAVAIGIQGSAPTSAETATEESDLLAEAHQQMRAVAHDLKGPLLTVSSYLELIADGAFGNVSDDARTALLRAAAVSDRAQTVVDSTLRSEAIAAATAPLGGPLEGHAARVDLNRTLSDVVHALNSSMRDRNATLSVEGRLPAVLGEDASLFRVFENVVQNAIKFCPAGTDPHVAVRSRRLDGATVEVTVSDNGAGMPLGGRDGRNGLVLTERGARGANAVSTAGHGLGLATVVRLVARMDGTVTFLNEPEGGACVRLTLPAA